MDDLINQKVNRDFERARRAAFLNNIRGALRKQPATLLHFEEVRSRINVRGQRDLGVKQVPLDRIIGSEGRYKDFDRFFLPLTDENEMRWKKIGQAYYKDVALPPIELVKIGDIYFVRDGNHRVSVARLRGQVDIDARVIEMKTDVRLTPDLDYDDLMLTEEQSDFLEWTGLADLRPGVVIEVSTLGSYLSLIRHINGHRYYLGLERGAPVDTAEAVASWYDNVYLVLVAAIRRSGVLPAFPGRTEADLYLWIMDHRHYLTERAGHDPGPDEAVMRYAQELGTPKARRHVREYPVSPAEQAFMQWSGLDRRRMEAIIRLSDPAAYDTLRRHLVDHQYYLGLECKRDVAIQEAATSWYDRVYLPVIEALERQHTRDLFPHLLPADLYLLVMHHLSSLKDTGVEVDVDSAVADYAARFGNKLLALFLGVIYTLYRRRGIGRWEPGFGRYSSDNAVI